MTMIDFEGFWTDEAGLLMQAAPDLLVRARTHLVDLAMTDPDLSSAKAVKEHYAACKQIQAYYEGLIKMLRSVAAELAPSDPERNYGGLLGEIEAELGALPDYDDAQADLDEADAGGDS